MTSFEYAFQDPNDPLIVDPFEYGNTGEHALAVRVIPPALAHTAAADMLRVRTAILQEVEAPKDVLARYDPATETVSQIGYITKAEPGTQYLSAVVGSREHIQKLTEKDAQGLPLYAAHTPIEIDPELPPDVKEYLRQQVEERQAKEHSVEQYLQTIGLAKLAQDEDGVRIEALDVHPGYRRLAVGSLLLYKGFGAYGNHAGVRPRPAEPEVQFFGLNDPMEESGPLLVQAAIPKLDQQLPAMMHGIGMGHDGYEYIGELRGVQEVLHTKLVDRGLIEAPESENS